MKKVKIFFDPRKEEQWLNSMEGYKLTKVGILTYTFEKSSKTYEYGVCYTSGKIEYLRLLNNLKNGTEEIKHRWNWTYIVKDNKNKTFYRKEQVYMDNLKLFVRKYSLYSRSFLLFGIAFLTLAISINIYFMICSIILFLLSFLYQMCIKTTKKIITKK